MALGVPMSADPGSLECRHLPSGILSWRQAQEKGNKACRHIPRRTIGWLSSMWIDRTISLPGFTPARRPSLAVSLRRAKYSSDSIPRPIAKSYTLLYFLYLSLRCRGPGAARVSVRTQLSLRSRFASTESVFERNGSGSRQSGGEFTPTISGNY